MFSKPKTQSCGPAKAKLTFATGKTLKKKYLQSFKIAKKTLYGALKFTKNRACGGLIDLLICGLYKSSACSVADCFY